MPQVEDVVWEEADFVRVAEEQNRREAVAARSGGPLLICDTDAFATGVWHERYLGARSARVEALAREQDLYLLTHPDDVPFEQDGIRDGEHLRGWMTNRFVERLGETERRWQWLRGRTPASSLTLALEAAEGLLREGWPLAAPLG